VRRAPLVLLYLALCLSAHAGTIDVHFSPRGGAQAAIVREIDAEWFQSL